MQTASPSDSLKPWLLLCLLFLAGCQSESAQTSAPVELAEFIDPSKPYSELRFTILDPRENQLPKQQFTPGNFEFPSDSRHFFSIRNLTHENVDAYVAELNRLGIKRVELVEPSTWISPLDQRKLLRAFFDRAPKIHALSIKEWNVSILDLGRFLNESKLLCELELISCWMIGEKGMTSYDEAWEFGLMSFSLNSCHYAGDIFIANLLDRSSLLRELSIREGTRRDPLTGDDWPFHKLKSLRKFTLMSDSEGNIPRKLSEASTSLESITIYDSRHLRQIDWANLPNLRELSARCTKVSDAELQEVFPHLQKLEVLQFHGGEQFTGQPLEKLAIPNLKSLSLSGSQLNPTFISQFLLTSPGLEHISVPFLGADLSDHSQLKSLEARHGIDASSVATLPQSIKTLTLSGKLASGETVGLTKDMLLRLKNLQSLKLNIHLPYQSADRAYDQHVNSIDWDFSKLFKLENLTLNFPECTDAFAIKALAVPNLQSLTIERGHKLTGEGWQFPKDLKHLRLTSLDNLGSKCLNDLPMSIESIDVVNCDNLSGRPWDFSKFPKLSDLTFHSCERLITLGKSLPPALENLAIVGCPFAAWGLDFSNCANARTLTFFESHQLPVDLLFQALSENARVLRKLNLRACPNLKTKDWDLSHLSQTLEEIDYMEGDSSLTGGIDEANWRTLQSQLPNCKILRSPHISSLQQ